MPEVLIVQPDPVCPAAVVGEALSSLSISTRTVRTFADEAVPEDRLYDGLVVLGGAQSLLDEEQRALAESLAGRIRAHAADERPVLGICLGAQLIGFAFGAQISRAPELQFGFRPLEKLPGATNDTLVGDIEDGQLAFTWHEDQTSVPPDAIRLLSSECVENYGFRVGNVTYGFQCHFEVTAEVVEKMLERGRHLVPKNLGPRGSRMARAIDQEIPRHLPSTLAFGRRIASRWASLVAARAAA